MQREHQDSERTTREIARQVGVGEESNSEERRSNTIQICFHETVLIGPRQIRLGGNSDTIWLS